MKIFALNPIPAVLNENVISKLSKLGDLTIETKAKPILEVEGMTDMTSEKLIAVDPDFCEWKFPKEVLERIPNLKAVILTSTSFSWIDSNAAEDLNIIVVNTRNFSSNAVAEWAITMSLSLARKMPLIIKSDYKLDYDKFQGIELMGKTAGIIGLGNIGNRIGEICKGLGMKVVYWSRKTRNDKFEYL